MKKGYLLYKDWDDVIQSLSDEEAGQLFKKVSAYQNDREMETVGSVKIAFIFFKNEFDRNYKKYETFIEKQSENGKKGGRPKVESQEKPKKPKPFLENPTKPNESLTDTDTDTVKDKEKEGISTNVDMGASPDTSQEKISSSKKETAPHTLSPTSAAPLSHKRDDIDTLLDTLRLTAEGIGAVYDTKKERLFAKQIMDAVEFGKFAERVNKSRIDTAVAVMKVSASDGYWKGVCAGPMMIYQNYSDVYNRYQMGKKKDEKKQDKVAFLPGVTKSDYAVTT